MSCHVLCGHRDAGIVRRLAAELREISGDVFAFEHFEDGQALLDRALEIRAAGDDLALVFCGLSLDTLAGADVLQQIRREPLLRGTRKILLDILNGGGAVDDLLQRGALQARLDPDFDIARLRKLLRTQLTDYVVHTAPHQIDELHHLLDLRALSTAFTTAKDNLERLSSRMTEVQSSVIGSHGMSDDKVEAGMIDEFDRLLKHPERAVYQPHEMMVREGDDPGTIWIILSGRVKLFRMIDGEDVTFHSESAGRIVGLMSLSLQNPVFFSCMAVTEVRALVLSREQVREAIDQSPALSSYLITVIIRSMARRNRRAAQLLLQVHHLNNKLERQRDDLEQALNDLQAAQNQLVESEKMATLGTLAAGMAHELNNPVAAIQNAARYLLEDVRALLDSNQELAPASGALTLARESSPLSTREERRAKSALEEGIGSKPAATRLLAAGIRTIDDFEKLGKLGPGIGHNALVSQLEHGGQIGTSLRNIENCSKRIAALVGSLKVYARSEPDWTAGVDIHATIEDVLLILTNKLREVEINKDFGELPAIRCIPSQLQQVWTNLIQNAAQAMEEGGRLTIRSSRDDSGIRIEIEDNGSGIPAEAQAHVFNPRFTTKGGRVEFGLGLGLPICKTIIERHGGSIRFDSQPGRTVFIVDLPLEPPHPESNS